MKALVWNDKNTVELENRPEPIVIRQDQVRIRIVQSGICGTDRGIVLGKFHANPGTILGHEAVGVIDEFGEDVKTFSIGDRVVVNPTLYCGRCRYCLRGELNFCLNKTSNEIGIDRHGTFADYFVIEARFVHCIPDEISFDRAVLIEPLVCALNNLTAGQARCGENIVILGAGPMGVLTAMLALHMGVNVKLIEVDDFRRRMGAEILASERCEILTQDDSIEGEIDLVIDAVGSLVESALKIVRSNGRVVVMGFNSKAVARIKTLELLMKGIKLIGAGDYNSHQFPQAIELAKHMPLERLITDRHNLEDFSAAFSKLSPHTDAPYNAMKVLLTN
jgi:2-desacetyl-2-hydroxyethyl bacteriochlorophyllide A dehydrogenase